MKRIERFLLSRTTVLAVMLLLFTSLAVAYFVPQDPRSAPSSGLAAAAHAIGFDHVLTSWPFAALIAMAMLSMVAALARQFRVALRQTRGSQPPKGGGGVEVDERSAASALRSSGYFQIGGDGPIERFVKHPWGWWGGVVLHLGMLIVIASSLLFVLTDSMGTAALMQGDVLKPGGAWDVEQRGLLTGSLELPASVTVTNVKDEYWENFDLKQLSTTFTFKQGSAVRTHRVWINENALDLGTRVYQGTKYGEAFLVELSRDGKAAERKALLLPHPVRPDQAGYADFNTSDAAELLRAKYFTSADKRSMTSTDPLLFLRLQSGGAVIGQAELRNGGTARLGPYSVRLEGVTPWVELVFVRHLGVPGVFAGFLVILIGSALLYLTPAREAWLLQEGETWRCVWRAPRFAGLYEDERRGIVSSAKPREAS